MNVKPEDLSLLKLNLSVFFSVRAYTIVTLLVSKLLKYPSFEIVNYIIHYKILFYS